MTGSNRRPPACKAGALPAELILHYTWQRPTLTGGNPQLPSALKSLTSVFGMGTGVTSSPSLPDIYMTFSDKIYYIIFHRKINIFLKRNYIPSKLDNDSQFNSLY